MPQVAIAMSHGGDACGAGEAGSAAHAHSTAPALIVARVRSRVYLGAATPAWQCVARPRERVLIHIK